MEEAQGAGSEGTGEDRDRLCDVLATVIAQRNQVLVAESGIGESISVVQGVLVSALEGSPGKEPPESAEVLNALLVHRDALSRSVHSLQDAESILRRCLGDAAARADALVAERQDGLLGASHSAAVAALRTGSAARDGGAAAGKQRLLLQVGELNSVGETPLQEFRRLLYSSHADDLHAWVKYYMDAELSNMRRRGLIADARARAKRDSEAARAVHGVDLAPSGSDTEAEESALDATAGAVEAELTHCLRPPPPPPQPQPIAEPYEPESGEGEGEVAPTREEPTDPDFHSAAGPREVGVRVEEEEEGEEEGDEGEEEEGEGIGDEGKGGKSRASSASSPSSDAEDEETEEEATGAGMDRAASRLFFARPDARRSRHRPAEEGGDAAHTAESSGSTESSESSDASSSESSEESDGDSDSESSDSDGDSSSSDSSRHNSDSDAEDGAGVGVRRPGQGEGRQWVRDDDEEEEGVGTGTSAGQIDTGVHPPYSPRTARVVSHASVEAVLGLHGAEAAALALIAPEAGGAGGAEPSEPPAEPPTEAPSAGDAPPSEAAACASDPVGEEVGTGQGRPPVGAESWEQEGIIGTGHVLRVRTRRHSGSDARAGPPERTASPASVASGHGPSPQNPVSDSEPSPSRAARTVTPVEAVPSAAAVAVPPADGGSQPEGARVRPDSASPTSPASAPAPAPAPAPGPAPAPAPAPAQPRSRTASRRRVFTVRTAGAVTAAAPLSAPAARRASATGGNARGASAPDAATALGAARPAVPSLSMATGTGGSRDDEGEEGERATASMDAMPERARSVLGGASSKERGRAPGGSRRRVREQVPLYSPRPGEPGPVMGRSSRTTSHSPTQGVLGAASPASAPAPAAAGPASAPAPAAASTAVTAAPAEDASASPSPPQPAPSAPRVLSVRRRAIPRHLLSHRPTQAFPPESSMWAHLLHRRIRAFLDTAERRALDHPAWRRAALGADAPYEDQQRARRGLEAFVMAHLGAGAFEEAVAETRRRDATLARRMFCLQFLTPQHLKAPPPFDGEGVVELTAREIRRACLYRSPHSILLGLERALRLISHALTNAPGGESGGHVGMDDIFPALVLCLLRAQVPHLHAVGLFVSRYLHRVDAMSRGGYLLTSLQSATQLFVSLDAESVGMEEGEFRSAYERRRELWRNRQGRRTGRRGAAGARASSGNASAGTSGTSPATARSGLLQSSSHAQDTGRSASGAQASSPLRRVRSMVAGRPSSSSPTSPIPRLGMPSAGRRRNSGSLRPGTGPRRSAVTARQGASSLPRTESSPPAGLATARPVGGRDRGLTPTAPASLLDVSAQRRAATPPAEEAAPAEAPAPTFAPEQAPAPAPAPEPVPEEGNPGASSPESKVAAAEERAEGAAREATLSRSSSSRSSGGAAAGASAQPSPRPGSSGRRSMAQFDHFSRMMKSASRQMRRRKSSGSSRRKGSRRSSED